ncbi:MAG: hypothetical protein ISR00_00605 [Flavobacteriales bacterium]|nr:hypothetical protein [Flavobacteriales bacterium]MBL6872434.1 hypothetical protein [Flavobacteriales bacterium]
MYWKDELDALYQKNKYGKRLWKELVGNQVELLLKNNLRQVGTILEVTDNDGEMHLKFEIKTPNTTVLLKHHDIKYIDPFLK